MLRIQSTNFQWLPQNELKIKDTKVIQCQSQEMMTDQSLVFHISANLTRNSRPTK